MSKKALEPWAWKFRFDLNFGFCHLTFFHDAELNFLSTFARTWTVRY